MAMKDKTDVTKGKNDVGTAGEVVKELFPVCADGNPERRTNKTMEAFMKYQGCFTVNDPKLFL